MWKGYPCVGLLTRAVKEVAFLLPIQPSQEIPVTDFHPKNGRDTYSGGTVGESHPIVLFSSRANRPNCHAKPLIVLNILPLRPLLVKKRRMCYTDKKNFFEVVYGPFQ